MVQTADNWWPIGSYESQALMEKHIASKPVQELIKGIEAGLVKESKVVFTEKHPEVGFSSRL